MAHNLNSDTLFAKIMSRLGNACPQTFATGFCWSHFFLMKLKRHALVVLSILFQQDGVPPAIMCGNSKEMNQAGFNKKLKETLCHLQQNEPFKTWSNALEKINELKKGSRS